MNAIPMLVACATHQHFDLFAPTCHCGAPFGYRYVGQDERGQNGHLTKQCALCDIKEELGERRQEVPAVWTPGGDAQALAEADA